MFLVAPPAEPEIIQIQLSYNCAAIATARVRRGASTQSAEFVAVCGYVDSINHTALVF